MTNPEPLTYEQALANAVLWAKKAAVLAAENGREEDARRIAVSAAVLGRMLSALQGAS